MASEVIVQITSFLTAAKGWMGTVIDAILDEPFLIIFCLAIPCISFAVGLFRRLLGIRG